MTAAMLALASLASFGSFTACSTDVDLGGTTDAGPLDTGPGDGELADSCEPCASADSCTAGATCAKIAGTLSFCVNLCPLGSECSTDELCELLPTTTDASARACTPKTHTCAAAVPPTADGTTVTDHCGNLDGPTITAACKSCDKDDSDCQHNGCYGGWWCNTSSSKCQKPPANCP
jgi:hypothetical protein